MSIPRIAYRYIFTEMLIPFGISLLALTIILLIAKVMELTNLVVSRGVSLGVVGQLLLFTLPYFFSFTLPMATLMGVMLGFLRLSSDNEVTALKAAGVGLHQLLPPVAALALLAWAACSAVTIYAMPWGNHKFEQLIFSVAKDRADLALKERVFIDSFPGLMIYIQRLPGPGHLEDVFIVDERDQGRVYTVVAKKGKLFPARQGKVILRLFDGTVHMVGKNLTTAQNAQFDTYDVSVDASNMLSGQRKEKHRKEMYVPELITEMDKAQAKGDARRYNLLDMELQQKFSLPFACLVMALVALPLGTHWKQGRSWGVALGLVIFLGYYLMLSLTWSLGETGDYPPKVGVWMPNLVLALLGGTMFWYEKNEKPFPLLTWLESIPRLIGRLSGGRRGREASPEPPPTE